MRPKALLLLSAGMCEPLCSKSRGEQEGAGQGGWKGDARNLGGVYVNVEKVTHQEEKRSLAFCLLKQSSTPPPHPTQHFTVAAFLSEAKAPPPAPPQRTLSFSTLPPPYHQALVPFRPPSPLPPTHHDITRCQRPPVCCLCR